PANRFEVLECEAARAAAIEGALDSETSRPGALDVLCQHILGMACAAPIEEDALYSEIRASLPYSDLPREVFDAALEFVATGGRALQTYERFRRLRRDKAGRLAIAHPKIAQSYRLNVGTIVEAPMLKVRLVKRGAANRARFGRALGEIEEYFIDH